MSLPVRVTLIALVVGLVVDVLTGYSPFPGYGALLGLGSCTLIIVGSKWLGDRFLQRGEDYYPGEAPADEQEDLRG